MGYQLNVYDELKFRALRILAHQRNGDMESANTLLEETLKYSQRMENSGWEIPATKAFQASLYAISGDLDETLRLLGEARQRGFRKYLIIEHDPSWGTVRAEPEFRAFVESLK